MSETREDHVLPESWIEIVAAVGFDESHECWDDLRHAVERAARAATVAELTRIADVAAATAIDLTKAGYMSRPEDYQTFARSLRSRAAHLEG